jgi:hypothetical protein
MKYNFVGYGSLLSHESLKQSIEDKNFRLVKVKGYKRIFNLSTKKDENADVLNIKKSKTHHFNGVLFSINDKELKEIKEREDDYNLEKVDVYDFKTNKKLGKAFFVIDYIVSIDKKKKFPSKSYFIMCRQAAYNISREFGEYWDKTTYISDNESVYQWIKKHPDYDTITKKSIFRRIFRR